MMSMRAWRAAAAGFMMAAASAAGETEPLKVGMVSDGNPFDDAGFNQSCKEGLQRAMQEFKVFALFRESSAEQHYRRALTELAEKNYKLIVGIGYLMEDDLAAVARRYTNTWFAIVDGYYTDPIPNVESLIFAVDQCAFPAGFLAAAWADIQDPADPKVGYVGGIQSEIVEQFTAPYKSGVAFYNQKYGKNVQTLGEYAGTFASAKKGRELGETLLAQGVDVLFGAGGFAGNGALAAAKAQGRWGIGVDVDQYYTLIDEQSCLLTSCEKNMDNAVYAVVSAASSGSFNGGGVYRGTLENKGVGLAPFHDFEDKIPGAIKKDLQEIQQKIISGELSTGWPPKLP